MDTVNEEYKLKTCYELKLNGGEGLTLALPNDRAKVISHRPEEQTHQ